MAEIVWNSVKKKGVWVGLISRSWLIVNKEKEPKDNKYGELSVSIFTKQFFSFSMIHTYNTTQWEAKGISSHNLASHCSGLLCTIVHISNPGVWEILCLAMKKYSVWQWRNTQGVSLHNPAAEAHVTTDWKTLRGIFGERGSRAQSLMAMISFNN